jgi:hypothetical protein
MVFGMRVWFSLAAVVAVFAACGQHSMTPPVNSFLSDGAIVRAKETTTAWGVLVDDPSGKPLSGVLVRLAPWDRGCVKTSAHTARCPGYLRWHTMTDRRGHFALRDVPNGEYLLVVGSDSVTDLDRPTIHDHVTFTGGTQHLLAPTLPEIPCIGLHESKEWCQGFSAASGIAPFRRPKVERNGKYRLTHLRQIQELACAVEFNRARRSSRLPLTVVDEWLIETTREVTEYADRFEPVIPPPTPYLTTGEVGAAGGESCASMIRAGHNHFFLDPRTLWFGGNWYRVRTGKWKGEAGGLAEYPIDPRAFTDPNVGNWL